MKLQEQVDLRSNLQRGQTKRDGQKLMIQNSNFKAIASYPARYKQ